MRKLRQALGDEAETPQYIETLPRRGYRFVGAITSEGIELTEVAEAPVAVAEPRRTETTSNPTKSAVVAIARAPAAPSQEAHQKRLRLRVLLPILIVAVLIAGGALMLRLARSTPARLPVTGTTRLTYLNDVKGRILTDGRRIYFTTQGENPLQYVSVNGGEATSIPIPLSRWVQTRTFLTTGPTCWSTNCMAPRAASSPQFGLWT